MQNRAIAISLYPSVQTRVRLSPREERRMRRNAARSATRGIGWETRGDRRRERDMRRSTLGARRAGPASHAERLKRARSRPEWHHQQLWAQTRHATSCTRESVGKRQKTCRSTCETILPPPNAEQRGSRTELWIAQHAKVRGTTLSTICHLSQSQQQPSDTDAGPIGRHTSGVCVGQLDQEYYASINLLI